MTLFASDVMIKDVITVSDAMPIKEVTKMFSEKRITGAPVVNAAGELVEELARLDLHHLAELVDRAELPA